MHAKLLCCSNSGLMYVCSSPNEICVHRQQLYWVNGYVIQIATVSTATATWNSWYAVLQHNRLVRTLFYRWEHIHHGRWLAVQFCKWNYGVTSSTSRASHMEFSLWCYVSAAHQSLAMSMNVYQDIDKEKSSFGCHAKNLFSISI